MPSNNITNKTVFIVLSGTTMGVVIIGALAMYFHRRKKRKERLNTKREVAKETIAETEKQVLVKPSTRSDGRRIRRRVYSINNNYFSPKKDLETNDDNILKSKHQLTFETLPQASSSSSSFITSSDNDDNDDVVSNGFHSSVSEAENFEEATHSDSNSLATTVIPTNHLKPSQLLEAGMDLVLKAQTRWKLALDQLEDAAAAGDGATEEDIFKLRAHLSHLLELSDSMKSSCSGQLLSQLCAGAVVDAALMEMDREYEATKLKYLADDGNSSDLESFYSTLETIDISDIEEHKETFQHLHLYEQGLNQLEEGNLQYRCLRTQQLDCSSDTEFLAKLYCIRQAFDLAFSVPENRLFFEQLGRDLVASLLHHADKDSSEYGRLYEDLMSYLKVPQNWVAIEEELKQRSVRVISFFDIVIDFLLFDAFDDLDQAPASIVSIINNTWITSAFKETAILTFVWSVLKAKKAMLKQPNGFMARFYSISEITSPVLAWGFLGPPGPFKLMCLYFKEQILDYVKDIFSFTHVRYTNARDLCDDVMRLARSRGQRARDKLSVHPSLWS